MDHTSPDSSAPALSNSRLTLVRPAPASWPNAASSDGLSRSISSKYRASAEVRPSRACAVSGPNDTESSTSPVRPLMKTNRSSRLNPGRQTRTVRRPVDRSSYCDPTGLNMTLPVRINGSRYSSPRRLQNGTSARTFSSARAPFASGCRSSSGCASITSNDPRDRNVMRSSRAVSLLTSRSRPRSDMWSARKPAIRMRSNVSTKARARVGCRSGRRPAVADDAQADALSATRTAIAIAPSHRTVARRDVMSGSTSTSFLTPSCQTPSTAPCGGHASS